MVTQPAKAHQIRCGASIQNDDTVILRANQLATGIKGGGGRLFSMTHHCLLGRGRFTPHRRSRALAIDENKDRGTEFDGGEGERFAGEVLGRLGHLGKK